MIGAIEGDTVELTITLLSSPRALTDHIAFHNASHFTLHLIAKDAAVKHHYAVNKLTDIP